MNQELIRKQQDLTARLNRYRHEYYNLNAPSISDAVYDRLFEELQDLERHGNVKKCAVGKHPKSEKLGSTGQAACCARIHSRYFTGGSPSGLRV